MSLGNIHLNILILKHMGLTHVSAVCCTWFSINLFCNLTHVSALTSTAFVLIHVLTHCLTTLTNAPVLIMKMTLISIRSAECLNINIHDCRLVEGVLMRHPYNNAGVIRP